ncbi:uncharacterized protein LOC117176470 [Belonocnema kinseyi]|uniref:uncharacterized protein LOC117176470 n=1 Tax=Belonocnema kinseyi TaxID=2817044 RepID=UPI00143D5AED|nr:uncharacterized protein LOC117176470 [Belonocnema kinseyi]
MALSLKCQDYKDPRFLDDTIINRVNSFVTLNEGEKKLNTAHLEKVIKEGLIPLMKKEDTLFEKRYKSIMYGGSYYKQTKVGKPEEYDLDVIICLPWREETLRFETPQNKPGFVKIQLTEISKLPDWDIYHKQALAKLIDPKNYVDQNKFRVWMESVVAKTLNRLPKDASFGRNGRLLNVGGVTYRISTKKSGPAFTFMIKVPQGHVIDVDLVACLEFSVPPPKRYKGFKGEKKKWLAIPKPITEENGNLMWRLCFYQYEKERLKGPMKTVIRLLKKLRDTENWKNFASYYIETLALHELESHDSSLGQLPLTCIFMHMLRRLRDTAKQHSLPFFWCKEFNLLERLSVKEMQNIAFRLIQIVSKIERLYESDRYIIASFILKPEELSQLKSQNIQFPLGIQSIKPIFDTQTSEITGSFDLKKHKEIKKQLESPWNISASKLMASFVVSGNTRLDNQISAAEGVLAFHTIMHHQSLKSIDCANNLLHSIFSDSPIARRMSCARIRTEVIVKEVICPHTIDIFLKDLIKIPYLSVSTDSSNHGNKKIFIVVIQYFDHLKCGIQTRLLDLRETSDETANTIATLLKELLEKYELTAKLTSFSGGHTNTNFGGLNRGEKTNVYQILKLNVNSELLGIGCPALILNNALYHGFDQCTLFDVDSLCVKIYNHFSIYTVRTKELESFTDFVEVVYRPLLCHSKNRWLSLLPVVQRILEVFPALKTYFLSVEKSPKILIKFFQHNFAECFLFFVHSLMSVFSKKVKILEKERNSVIEVINVVDGVAQKLRDRIESKFLPLNVKTCLTKLRQEGKDKECDEFVDEVINIYRETEDYLLKGTESISEFRIFKWIDFQKSRPFSYDDLEDTLKFLSAKNIFVDDTKLFDQAMDLKRFLESKRDDSEYFANNSNDKICEFFASNTNFDDFSEFLKIVQYLFSVPGHNANCERIFSLMASQCTDECNRLSANALRHLLMLKYNLKEFSCQAFYQYLLKSENVNLLRKIESLNQYT